ncbi:MAG: hypothetical protein HZB38_04470, partial [Planctomycetes bacterium]|nr:hypothetical protein [Planctomycetota bacterium]
MSHHKRHHQHKRFLFEHRERPVLPRFQFFLRLIRTGLIAMIVVVPSWMLGTLGFHWIEELSWTDSLLNSAMLLSGMGPLDRPTTAAGKLFASFYAMFAGIVFLTVAAVLFAPVFHR